MKIDIEYILEFSWQQPKSALTCDFEDFGLRKLLPCPKSWPAKFEKSRYSTTLISYI
jgi:hypothetical protein